MKRVFLMSLLCLSFSLTVCAGTRDTRWLNIVYIGNSITQGVLINEPIRNAPPVKASVYLRKQPGIGEVKYSNQGVSGNTTVDFLPETNTFFLKVKDAAGRLSENTWATLIFSIMLGTNDSAIKGPNGSPVSAEQYYQNMKAITDELLKLYPDCKVIIHRPVWYSPNTYNTSMYLKEGLERLESYFPQIDSLVAYYKTGYPGQVFLGDTEAFGYFKENYQTEFIPEDGNAGIFYLHPNELGAAHLGEYWGKAIYKVIQKIRKDSAD